jgi:hypothetical protein
VVTTNGRREGRFAASAAKSITVDAGAGNDSVFVALPQTLTARVLGGAGADTIDYSTSAHGVYVNLKTGQVQPYGIKKSVGTLASIEIVRGSAHSDWIDAYGATRAVYGNGGKDDLYAFDGCRASLFGGDGDDWLNGAPGAANVIDGGAGIDTVDYSNHFNELGGVNVSMDGVGNDGMFGETDNLRDVEAIMATPRGDQGCARGHRRCGDTSARCQLRRCLRGDAATCRRGPAWRVPDDRPSRECAGAGRSRVEPASRCDDVAVRRDHR